MTTPERPLIVVDVDLTIFDEFADPPQLMPNAKLLLHALSLLGEVHLWSGGGEQHCRVVAQTHKLGEFITDYHDKPRRPVQEAEAIQILGRAAALQIDDEPTERVADWPFVHADLVTEMYDLPPE